MGFGRRYVYRFLVLQCLLILGIHQLWNGERSWSRTKLLEIRYKNPPTAQAPPMLFSPGTFTSDHLNTPWVSHNHPITTKLPAISATNNKSEEMQNRRDHMRRVCHNLGLDKLPLKPPISRIPEFETKGILHICMGPKTGSTSWKSLGRKLETLNTGRAGRKLLSLVHVRHPLTRLASAYREKYLNGQPLSGIYAIRRRMKKTTNSRLYQEHFLTFWLPAVISNGLIDSTPLMSAAKFVEKPPGIPSMTLLRNLLKAAYSKKELEDLMSRYETHSFTFEEFINHVLWTTERGLNERTWTPVYIFCEPCTRSYDYLVRLETAADDLPYVLRQAQYPSKVSLPFAHQTTFFNTSDHILYDSLPSSLKEKVIDLFKLDFQVFGYSVNEM